MKASHAGGRKTQNDAARPALGTVLETKVEALLAAMTKGVEESFARAAESQYGDTQRTEAGVAARMTAACAALISSAARLNGQFHHDIRVVHVWQGGEVEEEEEDTPPLFAPGEIQNYSDEELLREIALRKAQYEARKAADHLAQLIAERSAEVQAPAPNLSAPAFSAPAPAGDVARERSERDEEGEAEDSPGSIARVMAEIETQMAEAEEGPFSEEDLNLDGLDDDGLNEDDD